MVTEWCWGSRLAKRREEKRRRVQKPLLPRYVFISMPVAHDQTPFGVVGAINGVLEFVGSQNGPVIVGDQVVELLKERETHGEFDRTRTHRLAKREIVTPKWVMPGAKVMIKDWPLELFAASIHRILRHDRVEIEGGVFGRATKMIVNIDEIKQLEQ